MNTKSKTHLFGIELKEKYGLNIDADNIHSLSYISIDSYRVIGWWGEKYERTISWSVDDKQPEDELLLKIGFSTGAYIFSDDYPIELFKKFWLELKSYKPDYTDEANKSIYFSIKRAKEVFNKFLEILEKYNQINKKDIKKRRIKKLQEELKSISESK